MTAGELAASLGHEVKQPITAAVMLARASRDGCRVRHPMWQKQASQPPEWSRL
jgi:hypothetical protein